MAQKLITIFLVLLIVGGLAWYINANYLQPSSTSSKDARQLPKFRSSSSYSSIETSGKIVFVIGENAKEIWEARLPTPEKELKKLFTDADEAEKLVKISNLATISREVFVIGSRESQPFSGKLMAINLDNAKETILKESFAIPTAWNLSLDGKKIAYVRFSNLEENYGYTLYYQDREGENTRELAKSQSEIKAISWSPEGAKISYVTTSGTDSKVNIVDLNTLENREIKNFDNKVIDWLSWSDKGIVLSVRRIESTSSGEIEIMDSQGKNLQQMTDFQGGRANFVYLSGDVLTYLIAQYKEATNDLTTGQIYIHNLSNSQKIPIRKGFQILGWLP